MKNYTYNIINEGKNKGNILNDERENEILSDWNSSKALQNRYNYWIDLM